MVSKTQRAIDYLELIPEPCRHDILTVAEKVNSSERTVYRGLRQLREKRQKLSNEYDFVKGLMSDMIFLVSYMKGNMVLKDMLQPIDRVRLDSIGKLIETFKSDMEFQEYLRLKEMRVLSENQI